MKLALFTVSYCGVWYKGNPLSLTEQIIKAKQLGFDGISIEARRPVASPLDLDKKARSEARDLAQSEEIEIAAVETMSNFASPILEQRENDLLMTKEIIQMASDLDVDIVKVFAAWRGVTLRNGIATYEIASKYEYPDVTNLERWNWCVEGIREAATWAEELGIVLALQNHPPVVNYGYEDVLGMVNEIGADNVKICLDVPLFHRQDDAYVAEAVRQCKDLIVHSHYGSFSFKETPEGECIQLPNPKWGTRINYMTFVQELRKIGYKGFLASEECGPVLVDHKPAGIEEVDRRVKAALKYMRKLIA